MASTPYAELHAHSNFSFLDGASPPDELVARAVELGLTGLGITDRDGLYGAVRFVGAAQEMGLHPVVGVEIELVDPAAPDPGGIVVPAGRPRRRPRRGSEGEDGPGPSAAEGRPGRPRPVRQRPPGYREPVKEDWRGIGSRVRGPHLVLLARSPAGWRSLSRLLSRANLAGTKGVPRVRQASLETETEGLVALSGCRDGELIRRLRVGDRAGARAVAERYAATYGRGDGPATSGFFIELSHHLLADDDWLVAESAGLAADMGLPVVVTNDVHYARAWDRELHDVLTAIRHGRTLDTLADLRRPDGESYLKSGEELAALGATIGEAAGRAWGEGLATSVELAASCSIDLDFEQYRFPGFPVPQGETPFSYLSSLCWEGAQRRYHPMTPAVVRRLAHELDVIERAGLAEFFLICWDLMRFAKEQGIPAQGRGSATSSIVSYTLGISRVEPIAHDLLFERFINPGRTTYPDVDIDFSSERREEVIQYIYRRYGPEHTGMVCNLVTYRARSAVREVGYALGFPRPLVDRVAKALETYDSVMVRRDLEADGGFSEFFKRTGEDLPAEARAAEDAEAHGLVDGMGQLNTRIPLVGKVPPWRQPPKPADPNAPRPFAWLREHGAGAEAGAGVAGPLAAAAGAEAGAGVAGPLAAAAGAEAGGGAPSAATGSGVPTMNVHGSTTRWQAGAPTTLIHPEPATGSVGGVADPGVADPGVADPLAAPIPAPSADLGLEAPQARPAAPGRAQPRSDGSAQAPTEGPWASGSPDPAGGGGIEGHNSKGGSTADCGSRQIRPPVVVREDRDVERGPNETTHARTASISSRDEGRLSHTTTPSRRWRGPAAPGSEEPTAAQGGPAAPGSEEPTAAQGGSAAPGPTPPTAPERFRDDPLAPRTAIRGGGTSDDEGGPGDSPASVAWLLAGRGTGYVPVDPEHGQPLPPPRRTDRLGRPSMWDPPPSTHPSEVRGGAPSTPSARGLEPEESPQARGGSTVGLSHWERWLEFCARIDGFPRHLSIHSGGMLVTAAPLIDIAPIERATMPDRVVVQFDKRDVETLKLIKLDLLGLGMLAAIDETLRLIEHDCAVCLDLDRLPEDVPEVFEMLQAADTVGVFQVESRAQMQTLPKSRPQSLDDLVVEVAIIRPGPIQGNAVHPFLRRKQGLEPVTYLHPSLEPVLKDSMGVILYQEQVMRIAIEVAGFTPAESDGFRRAMGTWRSSREMEKLHRRFVEGALRQPGMDEATAEELFRQVAAFASFGFAKSHAAAFARTAYESAFLKLFYPAQFLVGLINAQPMGFYPVEVLVNDTKRHGVAVLPVDINASSYRTTTEWVGRPGESIPEGAGIAARPEPVVSSACVIPSDVARDRWTPEGTIGWGVRLGLSLVKGIGEEHEALLDAELARGPYRSLADVVERTGLGEEVLERLIRSGAMDSFGRPRRELLWQLREVAGAVKGTTGRARGPAGGRPMGLRLPPTDVPELPAITESERIGDAYGVLGVDAERQVIELFRPALDRLGAVTNAALSDRRPGRVRIGGLVVTRQHPMTAKGTVFLALEDETGMVNVTMWPNVWERLRGIVRRHALLLVDGELQREGSVVNLVARDVQPLSEVAAAAGGPERPGGVRQLGFAGMRRLG